MYGLIECIINKQTNKHNKISLKNLRTRTHYGTCILYLDAVVIQCYKKSAKYETMCKACVVRSEASRCLVSVLDSVDVLYDCQESGKKWLLWSLTSIITS
jgi:hypothetical protein